MGLYSLDSDGVQTRKDKVQAAIAWMREAYRANPDSPDFRDKMTRGKLGPPTPQMLAQQARTKFNITNLADQGSLQTEALKIMREVNPGLRNMNTDLMEAPPATAGQIRKYHARTQGRR
jgi:hypothetical protein